MDRNYCEYAQLTKPALAQFWSESKEDGRAYKNPFTGDRVPSVTTITGLSDKSGLAQYAADRTAFWAAQNWSLLASKSDEDAVKGARFRWKDHADERAYVGNSVHDWIDAYNHDAFEFPELNHDAQQCVDRFLDFTAEHDFQPEYSEVTVWSYKYGYAGTLDWMGMLDGAYTLGDSKTSRRLHDEHRMQLSALVKADKVMVLGEDGTYTEVDLPEVEALAFLHLRPDDYDPLYDRSDKSFYALEYMDMDEVDGWFGEFLAYRDIWQRRQDRKALRKDKETEQKEKELWQ